MKTAIVLCSFLWAFALLLWGIGFTMHPAQADQVGDAHTTDAHLENESKIADVYTLEGTHNCDRDHPGQDVVCQYGNTAEEIAMLTIPGKNYLYTGRLIITVCDTQKALAKYPVGPQRETAWKTQLQQARQRLQAEAAAIAGLEKKLEGLKEGKKDYNKLFQEIVTRRADNNAVARVNSAELNRLRSVAQKQNKDDLLAAVQVVAKANSCELVLDKNDAIVLYSGEVLDITDKVIAEINEVK